MASPKQLLGVAALCALTNALPQGLDFNAISAAPTVVQGPAAIETGLNPAVQTAPLYTSFVVNSVAAAQSTSAVQARGVSWPSGNLFGQIVNSLNAIGLGSSSVATTVKPGASVTLNGNGNHNLQGNLVNQGSLALSCGGSGGLSSSWSGSGSANGNLVNSAGALIQLSDISAQAAANFNWNLNSFLNNGTLQFCARGDFGFGASQYLLGCGNDQVNNGLISFEQFFGSLGASFSWTTSLSLSSLISWSSPKLYNNGAFHLVNTLFHGSQNVYGSGCWQIGVNASLFLDGTVGSTIFPFGVGSAVWAGQSISFQDSSAILHLESGVYASSSFGATLFGFGSGNAIQFAQSISSISYSAGSGVLNVKCGSGWFSTTTVGIKVGQGYIASKFRIGTSGSFNAIFYDGVAPPQSAPAQCSISTSPCSSKPKPPTSSSVTTTTVPATTSTASPTTITTSAVITSTCTPVIPTIPASSYSPYYPALTTGYTTNPAASTTSAGQTCPTQVEAGTYCGFINPNDPCAPQPDGYGPVPTPDTASAFLAYAPFQSMANAAPTEIASPRCGAYEQVFRDLNASVSANSYLGLYVLQSYNAQQCASYCDANNLCTSFNIYIERDPTVNPSTAQNTDPTVWGNVCPNPGSMTSYKCTLWGSSIDASLATNQGGYRVDFQVVITGSDGYDRTNNSTPLNPTSPGSSSTAAPTTATVASTTTTTTSSPTSTSTPGNPCKPPKPCHGGNAINAPSFWMGTRFFPGPFNPQVCSDYALAQNALNLKQGSGSKCKMFNAYYVNRNGHPHGTTCGLYSSVLDDSWATYSGGVSGGANYTCEQSWTYELLV